MPRVDLAFLCLASLCLVVGVCLGIVMGIAHDFTYGPVHAHLNLLGWASLALFGLVYRAYPRLARSRAALVHLALSGTSGLVFPLGIYVSIAHGSPALAIAASLLWLAGALLFLGTMIAALIGARSGQRGGVAVDARAGVVA